MVIEDGAKHWRAEQKWDDRPNKGGLELPERLVSEDTCTNGVEERPIEEHQSARRAADLGL